MGWERSRVSHRLGRMPPPEDLAAAGRIAAAPRDRLAVLRTPCAASAPAHPDPAQRYGDAPRSL